MNWFLGLFGGGAVEKGVEKYGDYRIIQMVLNWIAANPEIGIFTGLALGMPVSLYLINRSDKIPWKWGMKGPVTVLALVFWIGLMGLGYLITFKGG